MPVIDFEDIPFVTWDVPADVDRIYYSMVWRFACYRMAEDVRCKASDMPSGKGVGSISG